jgi:hypothetical protein
MARSHCQRDMRCGRVHRFRATRARRKEIESRHRRGSARWRLATGMPSCDSASVERRSPAGIPTFGSDRQTISLPGRPFTCIQKNDTIQAQTSKRYEPPGSNSNRRRSPFASPRGDRARAAIREAALGERGRPSFSAHHLARRVRTKLGTTGHMLPVRAVMEALHHGEGNVVRPSRAFPLWKISVSIR